MHSNRIISIQRRAKRRLLVLAIAATAFVGYNALSLLADDGRPIQPPVEKMNLVPGVKAVGIRMINPSGKLPTARIDIAPTTANTSASLALPPSATIPLETSFPTLRQEVTLPPSGFINLGEPPRISEVHGESPRGAVETGITDNQEGKVNLPNQNTPDGISPESNDVLSGPTAQSTLASTPSKVRIAITDSGVNREISPLIPNSQNVTQPKNRFPQLVKSKPTQIGHTVVLAQSTNLELPSTTDQGDEFVPPVQIDSSAVPHSISGVFVSTKAETVHKLETALTRAVADTVVFDTFDSRNEPRLLSKHSNTSSTIKSIDSMRRSFDSSLTSQSPIATVELECLAATTMNSTGSLVAIAVQDENICKALHNGRTLSLVGNQSGTTLVQFWTTENGSMPQIVRVNVRQPWGKAQATRSDINDIKEVIARGFPRSDVKILSNEDGTFEVRGTTDSEESAKRILELVRKLYLVPVKDKLTVSN